LLLAIARIGAPYADSVSRNQLRKYSIVKIGVVDGSTIDESTKVVIVPPQLECSCYWDR
uniref:ThiF domain-containing protein n=1 Tax=Haemonchus placei TaxID=6290 RepID=A0A0N4X5U0_HAEPC